MKTSCIQKWVGGETLTLIILLGWHKSTASDMNMRSNSKLISRGQWDLNCLLKCLKSSLLNKSICHWKKKSVNCKSKEKLLSKLNPIFSGSPCAFFKSDKHFDTSVPTIRGKQNNKERSHDYVLSMLYSPAVLYTHRKDLWPSIHC